MIQILDCSHGENGELILLDGQGHPLPPGAEPVFIDVAESALENGEAHNSLGQTFTAFPPEAKA